MVSLSYPSVLIRCSIFPLYLSSSPRHRSPSPDHGPGATSDLSLTNSPLSMRSAKQPHNVSSKHSPKRHHDNTNQSLSMSLPKSPHEQSVRSVSSSSGSVLKRSRHDRTAEDAHVTHRSPEKGSSTSRLSPHHSLSTVSQADDLTEDASLSMNSSASQSLHVEALSLAAGSTRKEEEEYTPATIPNKDPVSSPPSPSPAPLSLDSAWKGKSGRALSSSVANPSLDAAWRGKPGRSSLSSLTSPTSPPHTSERTSETEQPVKHETDRRTLPDEGEGSAQQQQPPPPPPQQQQQVVETEHQPGHREPQSTAVAGATLQEDTLGLIAQDTGDIRRQEQEERRRLREEEARREWEREQQALAELEREEVSDSFVLAVS